MHIATYANGTTTFEQDDWISDVRVRSNVSGSIVESCSNLPFGEDLSCTGTDVSPIHFTGKERDSESGNDFFGARYYSSTMARFLTADWDSKPINVPYAKLGDPQTLDLYAYGGNEPLDRVDAEGHVWCSDKLGDCITDAQYDALKQRDSGECLWCFYTKHIVDDKKFGLSEAQAELLAKFFSHFLYGGGQQHLDKAIEDAKAIVRELTADVTVGLGEGGKVNIFGLKVRVEGAIKDNLTFSDGVFKLSSSIELGASGGLEREYGIGISATQVIESFDMKSWSLGGAEPTEIEWVLGGKNGGVNLQESTTAITVGGEAGDVVLGGGSMSISRAGVQDVIDVLKQVKSIF